MKVTLDHVSMGYGSSLIVQDLSLEIESGKTLVLLGPSGCGKTSTMRTIAGLETPTAGRITVGGRVVFDAARGIDVPTHKRRIGMVFQSYAIWPHMNVAQNVGFPLKMSHVPKKATAERVESVLELVGLGGMGNRPASMLSGGQMQRVALARSLAMSPDVILFDEPLSNLDAKLRENLRIELKHIQQEIGFTSIYVTHDQAEALALGDEVAVMREGRVEQIDTPMSLFGRPASAFVADFLGITNIFAAEKVAAGHDQYRLSAADVQITASDAEAPVGPVAVAIRPDSAIISPPSTRTTAENTWSGVVDVASYLGTAVRYRVQLDAGFRLDVTVNGTSLAVHRSGDRVDVNVPAERVLVVANRGLKRTAPNEGSVTTDAGGGSPSSAPMDRPVERADTLAAGPR